MSAPTHRRRVTCACGKTLMYLVGCDATTTGVTQIECGRCQYRVWRMDKAVGETVTKKNVMIVHTVTHATGTVIRSEVFALDEGGMRPRPGSDLQDALHSL